jgi:hypothetical protein
MNNPPTTTNRMPVDPGTRTFATALETGSKLGVGMAVVFDDVVVLYVQGKFRVPFCPCIPVWLAPGGGAVTITAEAPYPLGLSNVNVALLGLVETHRADTLVSKSMAMKHSIRRVPEICISTVG